MLFAVFVLLLVAVVLGVLGLSGLVPEGRSVARILLALFLVCFVALVLHAAARGRPPE